MSRRMRSSLVLHFDDPVIANNCIDQHIALSGGLLPIVKHIRPAPRCYNCQHTGHLARHCRANPCCGMCAGEHDTWQCKNTQGDTLPDQHAPWKCAVCGGPHSAADNACPAHRPAGRPPMSTSSSLQRRAHTMQYQTQSRSLPQWKPRWPCVIVPRYESNHPTIQPSPSVLSPFILPLFNLIRRKT